MITASGMYRAKQCTGSDLLQHVEETTELTEEGQAVHGFLRALPDAVDAEFALMLTHENPLGGAFNLAVVKMLDVVPVLHRMRCASLDLDPIRALLEPGGFHRELPLQWDPAARAAQELRQSYRSPASFESLRDDCIFGTPDLFSVVDGCVVVADWKGRHPDGPEMVAQLELYAVMVADLLGLSRARCIAVAWGEDGSPRVIDRKNGQPWVLEAWDLDAIAEEAAALLERRNSLKPGEGLHAGPWCGRCSARHACAKRGASLTFFRQIASGGGTLVGAATDEEIFGLRDGTLTVAKRLIEELEDEIRARAAKTPIRHPDGRVLGLKETLGPGSIDAHKAIELATAEGHPVPQTELSVTKSAIEAAVGQTAPKRGKTKHVKAFLERLEARGGIKRVAKLTEWKEEPGASAAPVREAPPASGVAGGAPVLTPEMQRQATLIRDLSCPLPPEDAALADPDYFDEIPEPPNAKERADLSPEAGEDADAVGLWRDDLTDWLAARAKERRERIAACEHKRFGSLGDCLGCGAMRSEVEQLARMQASAQRSADAVGVGIIESDFLTGLTVSAQPSNGIDKSTGHPVRDGKRLCSCGPEAKDCVDREMRT